MIDFIKRGDDLVAELLEKAEVQGYLTVDDVLEAFPDAEEKLDQIEEVFLRLGEAEIEVYEGALHGWCPIDSATHNENQAERAWTRLLALWERRLT